MGTRDQIHFNLNGVAYSVGASHAGWMLSDYLRYAKGLTGTKVVCAEGDCGACTVLRLTPRAALPVNACILTVAQVDGSSLVTVDALAEGGALTPVQRSMVACGGSQCGFCTPGFIMAMTALVEKKKATPGAAISEREAKNALTGNLCRCTGYQPILDAATAIDPAEGDSVQLRFRTSSGERQLRAARSTPVHIRGAEFEFFAPRTLADATKFLAKNPDARVISGGTDLGVLHNKRKLRLHRLLSLHLIDDLTRVRARPGKRLEIGARVTLAEVRDSVSARVPEFARFLDLFASPQIKNVATLAGNVGNASPIGDTPPFLLVTGAMVRVRGPRRSREIALEDFYLGYRKTALAAGEIIEAIAFDVPSAAESLALYKCSQRKDLDISGVSAAFRARWADGGKHRLVEIRIAYGGVAATPVRLKETEALLRGATVDADSLTRAEATLQAEIEPLADLRGSAAFRRIVAGNFLRRFFREHSGLGAMGTAGGRDVGVGAPQ